MQEVRTFSVGSFLTSVDQERHYDCGHFPHPHRPAGGADRAQTGFWARLIEAMMEARLRAAMRELNRHRHLVPEDLLKKTGYTATLNDDGKLPFTR